MNGTLLTIFTSLLAALIGFAAAWLILRRMGDKKITDADLLAKKIISEAEKDSAIKKKEAALEAKEELYKLKSNFEREQQNKRNEVQRIEKRLSDKESNLEKKLDLLVAFRQIDKVATLERIYTSAKELASGTMSPIKRWEIWNLPGELRELRIGWRREWEYHLNQIEDPTTDNWFVKNFSMIPVARPFLKRKQDTRDAQITEKISEGQVQVAYIEYSLRLEQLLAVASRTEKEFMVTLADELQQLDSLARLLHDKSMPLTNKQGVEPVVKSLNEIVIQYRSLLPEKVLLS